MAEKKRVPLVKPVKVDEEGSSKSSSKAEIGPSPFDPDEYAREIDRKKDEKHGPSNTNLNPHDPDDVKNRITEIAKRVNTLHAPWRRRDSTDSYASTVPDGKELTEKIKTTKNAKFLAVQSDTKILPFVLPGSAIKSGTGIVVIPKKFAEIPERPTVTNPETATKKPRIIETHQTQGEIIEDKRKEIELEVPVQEKKLIKPETGRLPTRDAAHIKQKHKTQASSNPPRADEKDYLSTAYQKPKKISKTHRVQKPPRLHVLKKKEKVEVIYEAKAKAKAKPRATVKFTDNLDISSSSSSSPVTFGRKRLNRARAKLLFGNYSQLGTENRAANLFLQMFQKNNVEEDEHISISEDSSSDNGPIFGDLDWLKDESNTDFLGTSDPGKNMPKRDREFADRKLMSAFAPLWYFMILTGRMPFSEGLNKNGLVEITLTRKSWRFVLFCLTSLFLLFILISSLTSTMISYNEFAVGETAYRIKYDEYLSNLRLNASGNFSRPSINVRPYLQLEMLHLQKHWLQYVCIMTILLFVTLCNFFVIFAGDRIAAVLSDIINSCVAFEVDASKWIWISTVGSKIVLLMGLAYKSLMYVERYTVVEWELNAYLTMSTTQFLHPSLQHIRTNLDLFPQVAPILFVIHLYILIAAYIHIFLPTIFAFAINNFALHWNLRLPILLGKIKGTSTSLGIKRIKAQLTYKNMLKYHNAIRTIVRRYSLKAFGYTLIVFYFLIIVVISAAMFKLARLAGINFDKQNTSTVPQLSKKDIEHVNMKYEDNDYDSLIDSVSVLLALFAIFMIVSEVIARVGRTIMHGGFYHVRRHGLLGCRSAHERRFIVSLYQSFSPTYPIMIAPGNFFHINRFLILGISEVIMVIFTTIIQSRRSELLTHEILGLCDSGICVIGRATIKYERNSDGVNDYNELVTSALTKPPVVVTVTPPTPTPITIATATTIATITTIPTTSTVATATTIATTTTIPTTTTIQTTPTTPAILTTLTTPTIQTTQTTPAILTTLTTPTIPTTPTTPAIPTTTTTPKTGFATDYIDGTVPPTIPINQFFKRCPGTDITRQLIFDTSNNNKSVELPTDPIECLYKYYSVLRTPNHPYVNSYGGKIPLGFDDCGIPSLPKVNQFTTQGQPAAPSVPPSLTTTSTITVQNTLGILTTLECQAETIAREDTSLSVEVINTGKKSALSANTCGMPSYLVVELCDAADATKLEDPTTVKMTLQSSLVAVTQLNSIGVCKRINYHTYMNSAYRMKTEKATEVSFVFRKDVPGFKSNARRIWIRQIPRIVIRSTGDAPFTRMKPGLKAIFLPYPITDITDTTKPGPYFDCFGKPLKQ